MLVEVKDESEIEVLGASGVLYDSWLITTIGTPAWDAAMPIPAKDWSGLDQYCRRGEDGWRPYFKFFVDIEA